MEKGCSRHALSPPMRRKTNCPPGRRQEHLDGVIGRAGDGRDSVVGGGQETTHQQFVVEVAADAQHANHEVDDLQQHRGANDTIHEQPVGHAERHEQPDQAVQEEPSFVGDAENAADTRQGDCDQREQAERREESQRHVGGIGRSVGRPSAAGHEHVRHKQQHPHDGRLLVPEVHPVKAAEPRLQPPGACREEQRPRHRINCQHTGDLAKDIRVREADGPRAQPQLDHSDTERQDGETADLASLEPGIHRATEQTNSIDECAEENMHTEPPISVSTGMQSGITVRKGKYCPLTATQMDMMDGVRRSPGWGHYRWIGAPLPPDPSRPE